MPTLSRSAGRVSTHATPATLFYGASVAIYALFRVGSFNNIPDTVTDTPTYEQTARLALWNWRFYFGERGFTIPLFFKLVPGAEARIVVQLVISIVAWTVLAAAVARCIADRRLRPLAFLAVLGLSLTTEVILWDTLLLSESITLALLALLIAVWLELVRRPSRSLVAAVLVLSLLWAFARDTNAYVLLVVGVLVALTLVRPGYRELKAVLAVGCCAVFLLDYASADVGKRWLQPMRDVVDHRVLTTPSLERYFVAQGFDPNSNWPVSSWMTKHARGTYAGYLLSHPGYALFAPFHGTQKALASSPRNLSSLIDPNLSIYNDNAGHRFLPLPARLEKVFFPRGVGLVLGTLAVVVAAAALIGRRYGASAIWLVPVAVLLTTYPHDLVVWHQSGIEVDRHALEAALLLRLAGLLLACFALDRVLTARSSRRGGVRDAAGAGLQSAG